MAKSGGGSSLGDTSSFLQDGDLAQKMSAIANYGNEADLVNSTGESVANGSGSSGGGFSLGNIPWGTIGQYMPAISQLLGNIPNQKEYNQTSDYMLPFYDAGSYSSNGFTAGGFRGLNSNVANKLNKYKQRKEDLANANAMFMAKYNLPKLGQQQAQEQTAEDVNNNYNWDTIGNYYTPYTDYYKYIPQDTLYERYA